MDSDQSFPLNPGDMGSDVFELEVNGHAAAVTAIPSLPFADYDGLAAEYKKIPSYCSIDPSNYMGVHYVWLGGSGPMEVLVQCPSEVKRCAVHPFRRKVEAKLDGKRVRLTLSPGEPRYFVVVIDDYPPLVLMIDPPESEVPDRESDAVFDLATVLSDTASVADRTLAIEFAIHKAAAEHKTVFFPAGVHMVNQIRLHNLKGVSFFLAAGCVLRTEVSPAGENVHSHGLWLQDSEDVRIFGRGCLDHQGFGNFAHGRNTYTHGLVSYFVTNDLCPFTTESPVFMLRCRNIRVEGLLVRNGRNMNFNLRRCDDITLENCKILTPPASAPEFGDGFHTNSCVNVRIQNCLAYCNDDCFASGHYTHFDNRDSGLHTVEGLVGWNPRANGVRLGFHTYYNMGDFRFENCDFAGVNWSGIVVHPLKDAPEAHRYQRYKTVSFKRCGFDTGRMGDALVDMADARMDSFELLDCTFDGKRPIRIHGHTKDGDGIKSLRLTGTTIVGNPLQKSDLDVQNVDNIAL